MAARINAVTGFAKKGQMNSIDAVLALLIFAALMVFFMMFWANSIVSMKNMVVKNRFEYAALSVSDLLVKSPGLPGKWENAPGNVQEIGLAAGENALSGRKLAAFANLSGVDYANAKKLLGIDSDFFFYVEDMNGSRLYEAGNSAITGDDSITITRFATLNGKNVRVRMSVYG